MANKKELLDNAFNEAISTVPYNGMDPQTAAETIKVAMQNIAKRDYHDFTDDEIKATIIAGLTLSRKSVRTLISRLGR